MRVGAIMSSKEGIVEFLGYGEYEGDFVPPKDVGGLNLGIPNPRIRLDSGDVVWGCECWWGPEREVKEKYIFTAKEVKNVKISSYRNILK